MKELGILKQMKQALQNLLCDSAEGDFPGTFSSAAQGDHCPRLEPADGCNLNINRGSPIANPGGYFLKLFTGQIRDGVQQMSTGIKHKAAARPMPEPPPVTRATHFWNH